jgi:hypothetical protein
MTPTLRAVLLVSSLVLSACGGGGNKPAAQEPASATTSTASNDQVLSNTQPASAESDSPTARAMAKMVEFEGKMCACKDAECAKRVSDEMTVWSQAEAKKHTEPMKMTDEETKRAVELGTHMGECMQRAMSAANP